MQNWDRLRVFAVVTEQGAITRAAQELRITGSAVSQQVRRLEQDLGTTLIEPHGRGIRLTDAGYIVAECAVAARASIEACEQAIDLHAGATALTGPVRIGVVMSAIRTVIGPALADLTERHPGLRPEVSDGETVDFIELLVRHRLDAAVLESWQHHVPRGLSALQAELIATEPVDLAVCAERSPAPRGLADVADAAWTACAPRSEAYQAISELLRASGLTPDIRFEIPAFAAQLELVAAGVAVALIPRLAQTEATSDRVRYIRLDPPVTRRILLVTRPDDQRRSVRELARSMRWAADRGIAAAGPEDIGPSGIRSSGVSPA